MNEQDVLELFISSKTKGEFVKKLNLDLSHKNGVAADNVILEYTSKIGYSTRESISAKSFKERYKEKEYNNYISNPRICLECGNIIPFEKRFNKFCCQSCGTSHSNKEQGSFTDSRKRNISIGIQQKIKSGTFIIRNQYTNATIYKPISLVELVNTNVVSNDKCYTIKDVNINVKKLLIKVCPICNKEYYGYITKYGNLSTTYCSEECAKIGMKQKVSKKAQERIKEGIFSG